MNYEFARDHSRENMVEIKGLLFVLSGKPETFFNRKDFINFIQRKGAKVTDTLSPEVDYLITSNAEDSKKKKAAELGIKIITERQFNEYAGRVFDITGNGVLVKYFGAGGRVILPDSVTAIGDFVFSNCDSLERVQFPETLSAIGCSAFSGCAALSEIEFPEQLKTISAQAFSGCLSLREITLPKGLTSIGACVFEGCENLIIRIPSGLEQLSEYGYLYSPFDRCCKSILCCEDLSLMPTVLRRNAVIGFAEDGGMGSELRKVSHLKYIRANASKLLDTAMVHTNLLKIMCSEKLITAKNVPVYLEAAQKSGDAELIALMLDYTGNTLTAKQKDRGNKRKEKQEDTVIDRKLARQSKEGIEGLNFVVTGKLQTFASRTELKEYIQSEGGKLLSSLSAKVDYLIMNDAESDAEKRKTAETLGIDIITEQQFNERLGRIFCITTESVLYKYVGLGGTVNVPNVVTFIGKDAFSSCPYLKEVTIPGSVISIGDSAFYHCTLLEKVGLSKGLIRIRQSAFAFCRSLKEITIPEGVLAIDDNAFWRCVALEKIVLPAELTSIGKDAFYDCAKLTIHAPAGSYAETYAKKNSIPFVAE